MRKIKLTLTTLVVLFVGVFILSGCSDTGNKVDITQKNYNAETPFVEDNAKQLSDDTIKRIADLNKQASDTEGKPQLLVVTVQSLDGHDIAEFAAEKGKQYGIGDKDANSGLVYVVSIDDHKDFLATGYGMEDKITDAMATDLLDSDDSHDLYKDDDYDGGVNVILDKVQPYLLGEKTPAQYDEEQAANKKKMIFIIALCLIFGIPTALFLISFLDISGGSGGSGGYYGSSGSSGGSSGGWSGGGGSFGGGGGGSSW